MGFDDREALPVPRVKLSRQTQRVGGAAGVFTSLQAREVWGGAGIARWRKLQRTTEHSRRSEVVAGETIGGLRVFSVELESNLVRPLLRMP